MLNFDVDAAHTLLLKHTDFDLLKMLSNTTEKLQWFYLSGRFIETIKSFDELQWFKLSLQYFKMSKDFDVLSVIEQKTKSNPNSIITMKNITNIEVYHIETTDQGTFAHISFQDLTESASIPPPEKTAYQHTTCSS